MIIATASPKGSLSSPRTGIYAAGNSSFGYFSGGWYPWANNKSTVDRIDYSNDTATASPKGPLSGNRAAGGATGNCSTVILVVVPLVLLVQDQQ